MEIHASDSDEINQYNIAITRCHEINGCVEDILFSLQNLQLKFTMPAVNTQKIKLKKRIACKSSKQGKKRVKKSDVQKKEKQFFSRRSIHWIVQMTSEFILRTIKIKRDFEGSLKRLEFIREKYDRKVRFLKTYERIQSVFISSSNSGCKCLSRKREK